MSARAARIERAVEEIRQVMREVTLKLPPDEGAAVREVVASWFTAS